LLLELACAIQSCEQAFQRGCEHGGVNESSLTTQPVCEDLANGLHQSGWKERFLHKFKTRVRLSIPGNQNDWYLRERLPDSVGESQSIAVRHLDVANDQIHDAGEFVDNLKGVGSVFGFQSPKILLLQDGADVPPHGWLVINNKRNWHMQLDDHRYRSVAEK